MGRPNKIDSINLEDVERMAALGLVDVEIAYLLGISKRSINYYKKNKDFKDALQRGKAKADCDVIESLYKNAIRGDTTACIFWLKNRRPKDWREKQEISAEVSEKIIFVDALNE